MRLLRAVRGVGEFGRFKAHVTEKSICMRIKDSENDFLGTKGVKFVLYRRQRIAHNVEGKVLYCSPSKRQSQTPLGACSMLCPFWQSYKNSSSFCVFCYRGFEPLDRAQANKDIMYTLNMPYNCVGCRNASKVW